MKDIKKVRNLIGQKFGELTVIGLDDRQSRKTYWVCKCDCGNLKIARSDALLSGATKSCGCLKKKQDAINFSHRIKHLQSHSRIYNIWLRMKARCSNIHEPCYYRYGGRGIKICQEWEHNFEAFYNWAINNGYSDELSIDRIDNNGNYEPNNCRWATMKEQSNNRRTNIKITIGNATKTLKQWCEIFELDYSTISARYQNNEFISIDELFNGHSQYRGNQQTTDTVERRE